MNKKEALLCAALAQSAYSNRCTEADFCLTATFENKGTDTQGLFGEVYGNTFAVAFRGSEETGLADWLTDAKFIPRPFPFGAGKTEGATVHQGFIEAYQSVREAVLDAVKKSPHQRVVTVGHSLGGALAVLCALDIQCNVPGKMAYCYTFGAPKVGNDKFVAAFEQQVPRAFRFVNGADVVPALPPGAYQHAGQIFQLGKQAETGYSLTEIVSRLVDKMEDHLPHNYIKSLREWV